MKVFLIILAVIVVLVALILSISAEFTIIFDNGWTTKIRVLFIEKDIELSKLLSFLVAPDKAGKEAAEESKKKKKKGKQKDERQDAPPSDKDDIQSAEVVSSEEKTEEKHVEAEKVEEVAQDVKKEEEKPAKKNPIKKILDEEGVVGILLLVSNLIQTANTAITTLIKGLHIYSLYVKMIIGGGDAATIAEKYGSVCSWYYPLKGMITTQMRVDEYDDLIIPDYIAPRSEYEFQFIGSISVGLLVKVGLKAAATFVVNYIKNK